MLLFEEATAAAAEEIAKIRTAVAEKLTSEYGKGHWSSPSSIRSVLLDLRTSSVYIARQQEKVIATLRLAAKKPWAIDTKYFTPGKRPLYLTSMAVDPELQRQGIGRYCLEEVKRIAREWPSDAVRLDAYDAEAGAGGFYARCGYREVGRAAYRKVRLIYFELLV
jgi:ribosomal protein S18 acetylase RimI-like enzyme